MARIRFPLEMADGAKVGSIDDLKEHFDLPSVLKHYQDKDRGLLTWLRDRWLEGEAEAVEFLDETAPDFQQRLCAVFGVEFQGEQDLEAITRRQERLNRLLQTTSEDEVIQHIDQVAFDQEELADLLDAGVEKIYLCGKRFSVPASQKGKIYIGVNQPEVHITGKVPESTENLGISFEGCAVQNLPQREKQAGTDKDGVSLSTNKFTMNVRTIEQQYPYFSLILIGSNQVTKFYIISRPDSSYILSWSNAPYALTLTERYLAEQGKLNMYYRPLNKEEITKLKLDSLGIPRCDGMTLADITVAKLILGIKLSDSEKADYKNMLYQVSSIRREYMYGYNLIQNLKEGKFEFTIENYIALCKARESRWYDDVPEPGKEENEFVEKVYNKYLREQYPELFEGTEELKS